MVQRGLNYRIIAYNDGSTDNSDEILSRCTKTTPIISLGSTENKGLGIALFQLLKEAIKISQDEDDIVIVLDSDNSHNPEHIYHMVNKARDGFDVVIASRYLKDSRIVGVSKFRQFLSYNASCIMRLLFPIKGVKDYTCGYRAYSIACLKKAFNKFGEKLIEEHGFACMAELLIKLKTLNILAVEIPLVLRYDYKGGESKMELQKTIIKTLRRILILKQKKM